MVVCVYNKAGLIEDLVFILIVEGSTTLFWQQHNYLSNIFTISLVGKVSNWMELLLQTGFNWWCNNTVTFFLQIQLLVFPTFCVTDLFYVPNASFAVDFIIVF